MNTLQIQQAKLYPPQPRPSHVARPRLIERLSAGLTVRLTVIVAPAGFGKSSLIGQWRAANPSVPLAWVSLDPDDNDPVRFWAHLATALDQLKPGLGEGALSLLAAGPIPPAAVARSIAERAAALTEEVVLLLDDFHAITASEVTNSLLPLLEAPNLHLWLITRADPSLPLGRLRAKQELLELRAEELRFHADEAAALLNDSHHLGLPMEWATALATRTEGWVTGLQLAALSLQGGRDAAAFIQAFTGSHRHIVDYLSEEVLAGLPERTRSFLLKTAILERLSGELCDAVTGESDGQAMLEGLERAGLFLIPLDDERRWYRYHHLFAEMLRVQAGPSLEGHRRAALWLHDHGRPIEAIEHALAATESGWAADWVERILAQPTTSPSFATALRLLESIPADVRESRPDLLLAYAGALYQSGQYERMIATLGAMGRPAEPHRLGQLRSLEAGAAFFRRDWSATISLCREALALIAPNDLPTKARALELLTAALTFSGALEEAAAASEQTIAVTTQAGNPVDLLTALSARAGILEARGSLRQAIATMNDALVRARPLGLEGLILVDLGPLLHAAGDLEQAYQVLTEGTEQCRRLGHLILVAFGELRLAHVAQARGDQPLADQHLARAAEVIHETANPSLASALADMRAVLALLRGDLPAAAAWADGFSGPRSRERSVILARVRLAQGRPAEAIAVLGQLQEHPEVLLWRAVALAANGDQAGARATAAKGADWAERQGYRQVLREARFDPKPTLIEPLTQREREILDLIAGGASNQEIADRLFLAVPTVKRHVGGLLGKLGASSRTHLVAIARERGIL